ncbi:hypothetical protein ACLB2K_069929 [Fragaria x ananassa]
MVAAPVPVPVLEVITSMFLFLVKTSTSQGFSSSSVWAGFSGRRSKIKHLESVCLFGIGGIGKKQLSSSGCIIPAL